MTFQGEKRYTFVSNAKAAETFTVVRFSGHEVISQTYHFEIELATEDAEIDLRDMLQQPAHFMIHRGDLDDRVFNGVLAEFEQMKESGGYVLYKAVLVPRLWNAGLYHENQLFLEKSVQDIIKEVLQQTRLTGEDYALRLTGAYAPWEYLCQWRETDLNFIHRWMEREGIYYYFTQDGQKEKMIITDSAASHQPVCEPCRIPYSPPSGTVPRNQEVIHSMVCRQQRLPNKVILRDYNYRRPSLELKAEATVDADGQGEIYFYGDHFKTPEEGTHLAKIRAQELLCRECVYNGESTAANLCAGFLFTLQDHFRDSDNQQYLVVEVHHQGHQAVAGLSGQQSELSEGEKQMEYTNRFTAIPANVQFRPERRAAKPKFFGTLNATVDASGNGEYAEIDDQGRYKVILPFDRSGIAGGRASRWIRMAQPYAGNNYGMHFPLHSGTEVLLTFVDGDPDRPIISGSVPNPETASPINTANQTQSMIRTGGGNQVRLEDTAGGQQINLFSPTEDSVISLGAPDEGNLCMKTNGTSFHKVGKNSTRVISGDEQTTVEQNNIYDIQGNDTITIGSNHNKSIGADKKETIGSNMNLNVGANQIDTVALAKSVNVGAAYLISVGAAMNEFVTGIKAEEIGTLKWVNVALDSIEDVGGKKSVDAKNISESATDNITVTSGKKMDLKVGDDFLISGKKKGVIEIEDMLVIRVGKGKKSKASITLKKNGDIMIKGKNIITKGSGNITKKSKKIRLN